MIEKYLIKGKMVSEYVRIFIKWCIVSIIVGLLCGSVGTIFHLCIGDVTEFREAHPYMIFLLPVGGLLIPAVYHLFRVEKDEGTNLVLDMIRTTGKVPINMSILIFFSTVITHLFGGSAGREGAALQLGGSLGAMVGRVFRLDEKDMGLIVMCGMSGLFAALFGTPITAAFFAIEVISVGLMYYVALLPCIVSALVGYMISLACGVEPARYTLTSVPDLGIAVLLKVGLIGVLCALVSILFCVVMKKTGYYLSMIVKNDYFRILIFGGVIVALTVLIGTTDYNGLGTEVIEKAIVQGETNGEAFLLKIIFTALTIGAGYKGGEIVPIFFIGSTFGCFAGSILGIDPGFAAALGLVAVFCGVVNCPVAAMVLSVELFGATGLIFFCIVSAISYMLSGYYSLYNSQKIVYSKIRAEYINKDAC